MPEILAQLTPTEVEQFARKPGVKRIAVENFLLTMGIDSMAARMNMNYDARIYGWNDATYTAILGGIQYAERKYNNESNR